MNDMNFWKHTFLYGASLFLACATLAMAAGADTMSISLRSGKTDEWF